MQYNNRIYFPAGRRDRKVARQFLQADARSTKQCCIEALFQKKSASYFETLKTKKLGITLGKQQKKFVFKGRATKKKKLFMKIEKKSSEKNMTTKLVERNFFKASLFISFHFGGICFFCLKFRI